MNVDKTKVYPVDNFSCYPIMHEESNANTEDNRDYPLREGGLPCFSEGEDSKDGDTTGGLV